ncbi:TPA_asm: RNA polymerase subunit sigma-24 [Listeria monocytogenes]|nr:RNA polymerase subunit sigma-24 [Listeria monocytogenes]
MEDLIREYKQGVKELEKLNVPEDEQSIVNSMISDMRYALEWMQTAKMPGNKRAIERRAAYQKEVSMDPLELQKFAYHQEQSSANINSWEEEKIINCLSILSDMQRECFYLHYAKMYSMEQVANMLEIKKATVQNHIKRADIKLKDYLSNRPVAQYTIFS